jgi:predicted nucleic acid-binding protein
VSANAATDALDVVVSDTGPLLCVGLAGRDGMNMLYQQLHGRLHVPPAVMGELNRIASQQSGKTHKLQQAAALMVGRRSFLKSGSIEFSDEDIKEIKAIQAAVAAESGSTIGHTSMHAGEAEAILMAKQHGAILLINDFGASRVARKRGLATASFGALLRVEIDGGNLQADEAFNLCQSITEESDVGFRCGGPTDLATLAIPKGFA